MMFGNVRRLIEFLWWYIGPVVLHVLHFPGNLIRSLLERGPFWLQPGYYWFIITFPFRLFSANWENRLWRNFVLGLPGAFAILLMGWLNYSDWHYRLLASDKEWTEAQTAIKLKELTRAEGLLLRILKRKKAHVDEAMFALAELYESTGNMDRSRSLFHALAPDNGRGRPDAHKHVAVYYCEKLYGAVEKAELDRALHHLEASPEGVDPELNLAWGRYYLATGDLEKAKSRLEQVTSIFPEVLLPLGRIYMELGQGKEAGQVLEDAQKHLRRKLEDDPKSQIVREEYAEVLIRKGDFEEAQRVLETGIRVTPDGHWNRLLAGLCVTMHDLMASTGKHDVGDLLSPLARSLNYDPNFAPALSRLMAYVSANVDENVALRSILSSAVASGKNTALAHLALGNVCWIEKDVKAAQFHFERSVEIDKNLPIVLNNLAWILANDPDETNYARALALVNTALEQDPANPRMLDTRGTILMKMKRWNEALADLETALNGVPDTAGVHAKLGALYVELGFPEIAREHQRLAQEK